MGGSNFKNLTPYQLHKQQLQNSSSQQKELAGQTQQGIQQYQQRKARASTAVNQPIFAQSRHLNIQLQSAENVHMNQLELGSNLSPQILLHQQPDSFLKENLNAPQTLTSSFDMHQIPATSKSKSSSGLIKFANFKSGQ